MIFTTFGNSFVVRYKRLKLYDLYDPTHVLCWLDVDSTLTMRISTLNPNASFQSSLLELATKADLMKSIYWRFMLKTTRFARKISFKFNIRLMSAVGAQVSEKEDVDIICSGISSTPALNICKLLLDASKKY